MQNNGTQARPHFTGTQMANHGVHGHPGLTRQHASHVNGPISQTSFQFNYSQAGVSIPHATYTPQGHQQGHPVVSYALPVRYPPGGPSFLERGNTQLTNSQRAPIQARQGYTSRQVVNESGWNPDMAIQTNPTAIAALSDLREALAPQPGQVQIRQAYHNPQGLQNCGAIYQNMSSTGNSYPAAVSQVTSIGQAPWAVASSPAKTVSTPAAGVAEAARPVEGTESSQDFQEHVSQLLEERGSEFKGYIRNKADVARYERAVKAAKAKNSEVEDKSAGYPNNESGRLHIIRRISDAFFKLDGTQDPVSDSADNNGAAFKAVRGTSPIEVEILANKLLVSTTRTRRSIKTNHFVITGRYAPRPARRAHSSEGCARG